MTHDHKGAFSEVVPCVVCGADCPAPLGVCPGPLDGSMSECERTLKAETVKERLRFLMGIGPQEMFPRSGGAS